jgi:putative tryptophan/tyrosine transport system substrate-binding protein
MRRRDFIRVIFGGGAAAWPLVVRAQQSTMPVIGLLGATTPQGYAAQLAAFRQGLSEAGFVEGRDVTIEYRWADDQYDRLPGLAADLVNHRVAVIATIGGNPASLAAKAATTTIPVVFHGSLDPVKTGFVASLNRPGGNATGVVTLNVHTGRKRLEILHEVVPVATTLGLLLNPTNKMVTELQSKDLQTGAIALGLKLRVLNASAERDFEDVFASLKQMQVGGLVIGTDGFFVSKSEKLAALTVRYAIPAIFQYRAFAAAGGLMSYGGSVTDSYRLSGVNVGRILKGAKPADLPVQQSTKVELIINLKTAKALGLTVPISLLGRADEVIE